MSDQCALDAAGNSLPAEKILFYASESDETPIPKGNEPRRSLRSRDTDRLTQSLLVEKQDEEGNVIPVKTRSAPRARKVATHSGGALSSSDEDDGDFVGSEADSGDDSDDCPSLVSLDNDEIAAMLPPKTFSGAVHALRASADGRKEELRKSKNAKARERAKGRKRQQRDEAGGAPPRKRTTIEEVPDEGDNPYRGGGSGGSGGGGGGTGNGAAGATTSRTRNLIYMFYESVTKAADGTAGSPGDKHYKCYHGARKVLTITRAMKSSLNGLQTHLRTKFPIMHRLYEAMSRRQTPPTQEEIDLARGASVMDAAAAAEYLGKVEAVTANIVKLFEAQVRSSTGDWDQAKFESLLTEWIVATDQPFDSVEQVEFRNLLQYTHHGATLRIPRRDAVRTRIMKLGEDTIEGMRLMFADLESKVSISLDAWTSSNQHPFLAIIAHYIANDGKLEETLIDFRELQGEHSGENMAEEVWASLEAFGLEGRIIAFVMDNASNNDTMIEAFEEKCRARAIDFCAIDARIRCMPHTAHLAAIKLLEAIGVISKADRKKASGRSAESYQETVRVPLSRDHDVDGDGEEAEEDSAADAVSLKAVQKLRSIVKVVRSSPQRRQEWMREVKVSPEFMDNELGQVALMLILDVKTRWSSTHQMLRRAIDYRSVIDNFVAKNRDLRPLELLDADWDAIIMVTSWLKSFRTATTMMSTTKKPMLSMATTIFRGLQDDLRTTIRELPINTPSVLRNGLVEAHRKLSDYYYKFDQSPYYTWAALLDPRISYEGLRSDFEGDDDLTDHFKAAAARLDYHFKTHYANKTPVRASQPPQPSSSQHKGSPQKDFTARYRLKDRAVIDELQQYYKLPREDFDTCDPIQWWFGRRAQFPNLFCLARDILTIPGSAVAVERIFSGGRDTISLRRASLKPETIRTLMIVKQRLRLARVAVQELIGGS